MSEKKQSDAEQFPDTLDALIDKTPELKGLPALTPAKDFDATQSADFTVLLTLLDTQLPKLNNDTDPMDAALIVARVVSVSDDFYKGLAKNKKAYREWASGRDGNVLFSAFLSLSVFYRIALGKSESSRKPTETAPSN